jgi:uncharacterized protein YegL
MTADYAPHGSEQVAEHHGAEPGALVMPFYLLCDVSQSMNASLPALNQALQGLWVEIISHPVVDDVARICIMSFSDTAQVVVPLSQLSEAGPPTLSVQHGTNYGAGFVALQQTIGADIHGLKQQGLKVYRPCVFFLTDGLPMDAGWEQTFRATLTYDPGTKQGMKEHPIFVPFGFDQARPSVLARLAFPPGRGKWHLSREVSPAQAVQDVLEVIRKTVVSTSLTSLTNPAFVPPALPPGSTMVQGDYDPNYV